MQESNYTGSRNEINENIKMQEKTEFKKNLDRVLIEMAKGLLSVGVGMTASEVLSGLDTTDLNSIVETVVNLLNNTPEFKIIAMSVISWLGLQGMAIYFGEKKVTGVPVTYDQSDSKKVTRGL